MDQRQTVNAQSGPTRGTLSESSAPAVSGAPSESGLTLALNAAENRLQIALADESGAYLYGAECRAASQGAEKLAPALRSALQSLGADVADIRRIACVRGPGSFTGLRLTAVTAAGLARTSGAAQAGLDYLALLAREAMPTLRAAKPATHLWVLVRARRDLVYIQGFRTLDITPSHAAHHESDFTTNCAADHKTNRTAECSPSSLCEICPALVASLDTVPRIIASYSDKAPVLLAGSGVTANEAFLRDAFERASRPDALLLPNAHDHPRPETLLEAALDTTYGREDIAPFYARPSDAEENLPAIAARLGLNPEEAQKRLRELTSSTPG